MRFRQAILPLLLLAGCLAPVAIPAANSNLSDSLDSIRARQAEIREAVTSGQGRYKDMSADTRSELLERQSTLLQLLDGKLATAELSERGKVEAANHIGWIDSALAQAEDERMVCEYRKTIGSNRKQRVCMTVAQQRAQREAARELMSRGSCSDCRSN
jgi:hypothetical protein